MTLEELLTLVREAGADGWTVSDERKYGWEFYFIRHRLDQNRVVNTEHVTVTLYKNSEDGKNLGGAGDEIALTASASEVRQTLQALLGRAVYAQNPMYPLRRPVSETPGETVSGSGSALQTEDASAAGMPSERVSAVSRDFIRVMTDLPETETADVNSYEIFVDTITRRLITSTGIDVTQTFPSSMLEVVTNAREEAAKGSAAGHKHEIELYRLYTSGTCDAPGLKKDITKTLRYGLDRLHTEPTPQVGTIPVLFSTADAVQIYRYFADRLNAQMIYQKTSDWSIGKPIAKDVKGDSLTVTARRFLPNSSQNLTCDIEGATIRDTVLLQSNVPQHFWGSAMYSSYLKLADTFLLSNFEVSGGSLSEAQIRSGRYLEIVEFSDFQADAVTGSIFGEIRLGYLHEADGSVKIVSGGSVSGSMREYAKHMFFSKETVQYDNALIPAVTKLMDVTVTGAAQ